MKNTNPFITHLLSVLILFVFLSLYVYLRRSQMPDTTNLFGYIALIFWGLSVISNAHNHSSNIFFHIAFPQFAISLLFDHLPFPPNFINTYPYISALFFTILLFYYLAYRLWQKFPTTNLHLIFFSGLILSLLVLWNKFNEIIHWMDLSSRYLLTRPYLPPLSMILLIYLLYIVAIYLSQIFLPQIVYGALYYGSLALIIYLLGLVIFGIIETPTAAKLDFQSCQKLPNSIITQSLPRTCLTIDGRRIRE